MSAMHGDGVSPEGYPPSGASARPIRILITLVPYSRTVEHVEVEHTPNVRAQDIPDCLETVASMLRADGPGVIASTGIIFGGIKGDD